MNKIEMLMLHCSATPEGRDYSEEAIMNWFKDRGWKNPGYRQITHLDGRITILQEFDHDEWLENGELTNGARGFNHKTIHLSYIGGVDRYDIKLPKDTRTKEQKDSLEAQIKFYQYLYPEIKILGHNQVARKACPSFYVPQWLREIGIPERNIFSDDLEIPSPSCIMRSSDYFGEDLFDFNHQQKLLI